MIYILTFFLALIAYSVVFYYIPQTRPDEDEDTL